MIIGSLSRLFCTIGRKPLSVICCSLQETYEQKRNQHLAELQRKEDEMRQMFVVRVKEKEAELKEAEKEVRAADPVFVFWSCFMSAVF